MADSPDIYDLSDQLQNEVIQDILDSVIQPDIPLLNTARMTQALFDAFSSYDSLISCLFSGNQASILPERIEHRIKETVFQSSPQLRDDLELNVLLTYQIYGSYYAYWKNCAEFGNGPVLEQLDTIASKLQPSEKK